MKYNNLRYRLSCLALLIVFGLQSSFTQSSSFPYTGEDLFAGIYFSEGPLVSKIQTLQKYSYKNEISDPKIRESNKKFQEDVAAIIRKNNPGFFNTLRDDVASGNLSRIGKVLDNGSNTVYDAMVELMYSRGAISQLKNQEEELAYLREFINSYTGGVYSSNEIDDKQALIALAAVWVAVVAWEYFWVSDEFIINENVNNEGNLKKEQLVMELSRL